MAVMTEAQRIALDALITAMRRGQFPVGWTEHQIMAVGDIVLDATGDVRYLANTAAAETVESVEQVLMDFGAIVPADRGKVDVVQMLEILLPPAVADRIQL